MTPPRSYVVGVLSDTHGLLRPGVVEALQGCDHIVHAGDVGDPGILEALEELAPVTAVRGNCDHGPWALGLPLTAVAEVGEHSLYVLHVLEELDLDPASAGLGVVIHGHTHQPAEEEQDGVLFLNPGSAGPRRFRLPLGLARLHLEGEARRVEFLNLD